MNIKFEDYSKLHIQFYDGFVDKEIINIMSSIKKNAYVMDLGCGDGNILKQLVKTFEHKKLNFYGIDLSELRINKIKNEIKNGKFYVGDLAKLEVSDLSNKFDFVYSTQVIEHVVDQEGFIKSCGKLLKKEGCCYISTIYKKNWAWYFYKYDNKWVLDPTHVIEYDNKSIIDLEKKLLKIFHIEKRNFVPVWFSVLEMVFRKMKINSTIFEESKLLAVLRKIKVPIPGYYYLEYKLKLL